MADLETKIQKLVQKGKGFEAYKILEKQLEQQNPVNYSENMRLLSVVLEHLKETQDNIINDILYYSDKNLDNSDWITRRNALDILAVLAKKFPKTFISRQYLSSLRGLTSKDSHWEVRFSAINIYGLLGEHVPERVLLLLKDRLNDEDDDVRKNVVRNLINILEKNTAFIPEFLPLFKKLQTSDPHWEVQNIAGSAVESLSNLQTLTQDIPQGSQETFFCPFCGKSYTKTLDMCLSCGKEFPRCNICKEIIRIQPDSSIAFCPHCKALFHPDHLKNWILVNQNCPSCMNPLNEKDIKFLQKQM